MDVYKRIVDRVRGAMWAHHRRLLPERQAQRILGYVYSNKHEYQVRFDRMTVVGTQLDGRVEVATTPAGHIRRVRVHPEFEDLPRADQERLVMAAYVDAMRQGRELLQQAELRVYAQFMRDIKPLVLGVRDTPDFYTVAPDAVELANGVLASPSSANVHRTIPYDRAYGPSHEQRHRDDTMRRYLATDDGARYLRRLRGKEYARYFMPERRPPGAPGAKKRAKRLEVPVAYTPMDERALLRRNWQAYLDNRNVAEQLWTRTRLGDRMKQLRHLQKVGRAWHAPVADEARL
jgi:hypothetical protein